MPQRNRPQPPHRKDQTKKSAAGRADESRPADSPATPEAGPETEELTIVQEHPEDAPAGWVSVQQKLAAAAGLSVLLVDGRQPPALVASNNNSICRAFQSSMEYVGLCDPYCGDAHRRALSAGSAVSYKCHAGLQCFTMPVHIGREQNLAAIGGRAFVSTADYRNLVERFRGGELNDLLSSEPFENVIFAESERLDQLSERLQKAVRHFNSHADTIVDQEPVAAYATAKAEVIDNVTPTAPVVEDSNTVAAAEDTKNQASTFAIESDPDLKASLEALRRWKLGPGAAESVEKLAERFDLADPVETYKAILAVVNTGLNAERASLMILDEATGEIVLKESEGLARAEEVTKIKLGEGIAGKVLQSGKAQVTEHLETATSLAPGQRNYKTRSFISFPLITKHGWQIGVLNVADKVDGGKFSAVDLIMLEMIGPRIASAVERAVLMEHSYTDPLTGLLNRRHLKQRLTEEINRSQRHKFSMSCLMIDIDDFKTYNDRHGHPAGDEALKTTAHMIKAALRATDVAFRYGGEEFSIMLPQTSLVEAGVLAERMRQRIAEANYTHGKSQPLGMVSVSIGIASFGGDIDSADRIIDAADQALYRAKKSGKNRIEFYVGNSSQ